MINLIPGPDLVYTLNQALAGGRKNGFICLLGTSLGLLFYVVFTSLGLSALLMLHPSLYEAIKILGAIYIIYLGINLLRSGKNIIQIDEASKTNKKKSWKIYKKAVLINLLNPKIALFFFAFLPQFLTNTSKGVEIKLFELGLMFVLINLFVVSGIIIVLGGMFNSNFVQTKMRVINFVFGLVLIGIAFLLVFMK